MRNKEPYKLFNAYEILRMRNKIFEFIYILIEFWQVPFEVQRRKIGKVHLKPKLKRVQSGESY